jgi:hypothetical protein
MIENVYFFNNYHNGDVFYSKEFIKDIKSKIGKNHYYIHSNDFSILKDIDIEQIRKPTPKNDVSVIQIGDDLYINTWVGQQQAKYLNETGCNLNANYNVFCDIYDQLNLKINPIKYYIPKVDFEKVETQNIDNFIQPNKKYVLVCNNNVWSGQSENFNFYPIIDNLSNIYPNIIFIMTNDIFLIKDNIINVDNILGFNKNLLEISYISTKTDVIIGRASGPFCFTHISDNMENENKILIGFSYKERESKYIADNNCQAKQYWYNVFENNSIINNINNILKTI